MSRRPGRGSALTRDERHEIQRLGIVEGCSISEIARRTDRDRGTVANVLNAQDSQALRGKLATDARDEVLRMLQITSPQAAREWARAVTQAANKGDHRPARDLLLHAGAIDPIADDASNGPRIAIVIGTDEHPMNVRSPLRMLELEEEEEKGNGSK